MNHNENHTGLPYMLTAKDAQKAFGISRSLAYTLLNRKDIGVIVIGSRKFFHRDSLLQWLDSKASFNSSAQNAR